MVAPSRYPVKFHTANALYFLPMFGVYKMFLRAMLSAALLASTSHSLANEYFVVVPMPGKVSPVTLTLTDGAPPAGLVGSAYLYDFKPHLEVLNDASFSGAGVTWSVMGSALPDGLSLSSDGVVSGVPQTAGIYEAILRADYKQKNASNSYSFSIGANGNLALGTPGSYTWTVPPGVTSVSVVVVGGGGAGGNSGASTCKERGGSGGASSFGTHAVASGGEGGYSVTSKGGVVLAGDGGGAGGASNGGGGGAGGYSGVGGEGSWSSQGYLSGAGGGVGLYGEGVSGAATGAGKAGSGGAGGGGAGGTGMVGPGLGGKGGSGGADGQKATSTQPGNGGAYGAGGGGGSYCRGGGGGALAYKNNIQVTPGMEIVVSVGAGGAASGVQSGAGGAGAVRIVWPGNTRQFPSLNVAAD